MRNAVTTNTKKLSQMQRKRMLVGYTFILPWVIGLVSLFVIPIVESFL